VFTNNTKFPPRKKFQAPAQASKFFGSGSNI